MRSMQAVSATQPSRSAWTAEDHRQQPPGRPDYAHAGICPDQKPTPHAGWLGRYCNPRLDAPYPRTQNFFPHAETNPGVTGCQPSKGTNMNYYLYPLKDSFGIVQEGFMDEFYAGYIKPHTVGLGGLRYSVRDAR